MGKKDTKDLLKFLSPFPEEIVETVLWLRDFVWSIYPKANELIYDNYNAVAFGWSLSDKLGDTFCSIAVGRSSYNIHFGFYWGNKIEDPEKILLGKGNQYRYILVKQKKDFPKTYITKLMKHAFDYSVSKAKNLKDVPAGTTITKAVSKTKRIVKKIIK